MIAVGKGDGSLTFWEPDPSRGVQFAKGPGGQESPNTRWDDKPKVWQAQATGLATFTKYVSK